MKRLIVFTLLLSVSTLAAAEREVSLKRDFGTLRGTMCTPDAGSEVAVLIIAGSGPTDRNCNSPRAGLNTNSFIYLAQALEKQGIASLRYDKRGIGASSYDDPKQIYNILFDHYVSDAAAWVEWLRGEGFKKVIIAGHSEGALVALCAATQTAYGGTTTETTTPLTTGLDALILLAGAGYPIDEVLLAQLSTQLTTTQPMLLMDAMQILGSLKQGRTVDKYPKELEMLFAPYLQRYMISQIKHNPQKLIAQTQCPVLIVNGDNDIQVSAANAEALHKANPKSELLIIDGMTHTLKQSTGHDAQSQMAVYMDGTISLDPTLTKALPKFIKKL